LPCGIVCRGWHGLSGGPLLRRGPLDAEARFRCPVSGRVLLSFGQQRSGRWFAEWGDVHVEWNVLPCRIVYAVDLPRWLGLSGECDNWPARQHIFLRPGDVLSARIGFRFGMCCG